MIVVIIIRRSDAPPHMISEVEDSDCVNSICCSYWGHSIYCCLAAPSADVSLAGQCGSPQNVMTSSAS